jgi:hypothetical protein
MKSTIGRWTKARKAAAIGSPDGRIETITVKISPRLRLMALREARKLAMPLSVFMGLALKVSLHKKGAIPLTGKPSPELARVMARGVAA